MAIAMVLIISSILLAVIFRPRVGWFIIEGWRFRNIEPNAEILALSRASAFIILFVLWFVLVPFTSIV